jgi:acylpyruvate hydrolase
VQDAELILTKFTDIGHLLAANDGAIPDRIADGPRVPSESCRPLTPVPHPNKIICLGLNYESHIREMGRTPPTYPTLFSKFDGALIGPEDTIMLPRVSDRMDWEAELGVVIGRPGRDIAESAALDHVAGFTVMNDVTARDWQTRTSQFLSGKTFERTTPVGPVVVTPDELPPGGAGLTITCEIDGVVMQQARTDDLVFSVASIISYVSRIITLLPGDLIATGTPGGVGAGRDPQIFLSEGQVMTTSIGGIGTLRNPLSRTRNLGDADPAQEAEILD